MQISLRSQMIAGTTALVGATAIAMTPMAPAVSLPSLSSTKAAIALAAVDNPISALIDTGSLALNYLIDSNYTLGAGGGLANWGSSVLGLGTTVPNVGDAINLVIRNNFLEPFGYLPQITSVGIVPNFLAAPFPIGIQVVNNLLGYVGVVADTGAAVLGDLSSLVWAPVGITIAVAQAVITGNISAIPTIIQNGIQAAITGVTDAIATTVAGVQYILGSVVAKATAVVNNLTAALPQVVEVVQGQIAALSLAATRNVTAIQTALATGSPEAIWNAAVTSLLGPTGLPGTLLNLTLGAGQQLNPADPTTFVPSVRSTVQTLQQSIKGALGTAPASASAVRSAAAAKTVAPAAAAADSTEAASSDAAPAPAKKAAKAGRHAARAAS